MRKIIYNKHINPTTFKPIMQIILKDVDGNIITLCDEPFKLFLEPEPKYSPEELEKINICNEYLAKNGHELMTEEEISYMLDPTGLSKLDDAVGTIEDLQKLAGFKVEKTIVYLDKKVENDTQKINTNT